MKRVYIWREIFTVIWTLISLPVTYETHKLFFLNYVTDMNDRSRVQPFSRGGTKTGPENTAEIEPRVDDSR